MEALPPSQAAATALRLVEGLWDAREQSNLRIAIPHIVVICTRADRWEEAAVLDGLLGDSPPPLLPQHANRFQQARLAIDANLQAEADHLRSRSATWSQATAVEYLQATLQSISDAT